MAKIQFILVLVGISICASDAGPEFDFEVSSQGNNFLSDGQRSSKPSIASDYSKSGKKSLLWKWGVKSSDPKDVDPSLTLKLDATTTIKGKELQKGGIKFWMYHKEETTASRMNIVFQDYDEAGNTLTKDTPAIAVNLGFKGWRAVWIGYKEFGLDGTDLQQFNRVKFTITTDKKDELYIDLFRFATEMNKQTRDKVVPDVPIIGMGSPRNYDTHPLLYDDKDYWQQSLRWDKYTQHNTPKPTDVPDAGLISKLNEINDIEDRLDDWYAKTGESLTYFQTDDDCEAFKKQRWNTLQRSIEKAHDSYAKLSYDKTNKVINGPSLFSKVSELGEDSVDDSEGKTKFGFIFTKILLPLSLEYYLMSRDGEANSLAENECENLKSSKGKPFQQAISNIAGKNSRMRNELETMLTDELQKDRTLLDCSSKDKVKKMIQKFNEDVRFSKILRLLNYVENEGWAAGSGLGSLDHEMNKAGAGFMHSMFLLRHKLRQDSSMLTRLLKTMKWYTDFNEIYQPIGHYSYDGTTADRMRTILLYRLMIILIPSPRPTETEDQKQKVYDMNCFKSWFENTLKINKGLGGVIKPDYTGFHHMTFYGSAYVPQALHVAALVKYLLGDGSNYALSTTSSGNLRKALGVLRIVAVKYSTPNGLCGRFPDYQKSILSEHFPSYAYMSYVHQSSDLHRKDAEIFLRLFDITDPAIVTYVSNGKISSPIYYLNSIGSIDILCKVKSRALTKGFVKEASPSGHWSKNFAALSTHRRGDWSVSAKGFSKYVWDFENAAKENVFGVFQSYGSLQISNSEDALKKYDVTEGWDWTKIPGATTINIDLLNMITDKARYYSQNGGFAGGVSLKGQNGVFGMHLAELPNYKTNSKSSPLATMDFSFHKMYFFYDHLIVCVGNRITSNSNRAQTTLFQDKLLDPAESSTIKVDKKIHDLRVLYENKDWSSNPVILEDTNGNAYSVKNPMDIGLKVKISDQASRDKDGCEKTKGRYATAWLEHSAVQNYYEYAILIKGRASNLFDKYTVMKRDGVILVEVEETPGEITVGYSVFLSNQKMPRRSKGPVKRVNKPCLIMTSVKGNRLHFAISDPSIKFKASSSPNPQTCSVKSRRDVEQEKLNKNYLEPAILDDVLAKLLFCVEADKSDVITVRLKKKVKRIRMVKVNGEDKTTEKDTYVKFNRRKPRKLKFLNLMNGFTTELELEI